MTRAQWIRLLFAAMTLAVGSALWADDSELFINVNAAQALQPNVLWVVGPTRDMESVKAALKKVVTDAAEVNMGLAQGEVLLHPVQDVAAARAQLLQAIDSITAVEASSLVDLPSLAERACQRNHVVLLADAVSAPSSLGTHLVQPGSKSADALASELESVVARVLEAQAIFVAAAPTVSSFSQTEIAGELYVSVFQPADTVRWTGNLKKYALQGGRIFDALGNDAVDANTGLFKAGAQSFWSTATDGHEVSQGGAVSQLPESVRRHVYTQFGPDENSDLTAAENNFAADNAALSNEVLALGAEGPTREVLIEWARGAADASALMGDSPHARPTLVTYNDVSGRMAYTPTNNGFLHAIDASTGVELWSFIPRELLPRLSELYRNPVGHERIYGLDGEIRVLRFDADQDGAIDASAGDRVWLFFGMRRGGRYYYALDVTDRHRPQLLWKAGADSLPGVGETWSLPTVARVRVNGAPQNGEHLVLIFGGGYDKAHEENPSAVHTAGHRIFMIDAATGQLLWYAGGPSGERGDGGPDLSLPEMKHSIPGRVVVIDTDGDQFADRLYAADLGGRVWRFDLWNGRTRERLVTGGVLADLQGRERREFFYAPDVALMTDPAGSYYNLAIGSGNRSHPLDTVAHDRFYALRDRAPFGKMTQAEYSALSVITEEHLVDITDSPVDASLPADARGWKLELRWNGGWTGEKVLAESLTVNGVIMFSTYQPSGAGSSCAPVPGRNRVYALDVRSARPAVDFNNDARLDEHDISTQLTAGGIANGVQLILQSTTATGSDSAADDVEVDRLGRRATCLAGAAVLDNCVSPGALTRTFWYRTHIE